MRRNRKKRVRPLTELTPEMMAGEYFGHFARPLRGHDAGQWALVVGETADRLLLADGRCRPLERPKWKNWSHVECSGRAASPETLELIRHSGGGVNEAIKREIRLFQP